MPAPSKPSLGTGALASYVNKRRRGLGSEPRKSIENEHGGKHRAEAQAKNAGSVPLVHNATSYRIALCRDVTKTTQWTF